MINVTYKSPLANAFDEIVSRVKNGVEISQITKEINQILESTIDNQKSIFGEQKLQYFTDTNVRNAISYAYKNGILKR